MKSAIFILLIIFMAGCSQLLEEEFVDKPVVESYLYVGKPASVKISRMTTFDASSIASSDDINNLQVFLTSEGQETLLEAAGEGIYKSTYDFKIDENVDYELKFNFNEMEISASTRALSKPESMSQSVTSIQIASFTPGSGGFPSFPDPVEITWSNDEGDFYLVVVENAESDPEAINDFGDDGPPPLAFRNEPTQSTQYEIRSMQFQYYGTHRIILFHISPAYAALYKDSGTTSQNITTPQTNIINGLGIFTAINSDTLYLKVEK